MRHPSSFIPAPLRVRRKRKQGPTSDAPAALTLVSAIYEAGAAVTLTFDRAIDIAGLDGNVVMVEDGVHSQFRYAGTAGATLLSPTTVQIELAGVEEFVGPDIRLNVGITNGIVAVDDGGTWLGASDVELPFP